MPVDSPDGVAGLDGDLAGGELDVGGAGGDCEILLGEDEGADQERAGVGVVKDGGVKFVGIVLLPSADAEVVALFGEVPPGVLLNELEVVGNVDVGLGSLVGGDNSGGDLEGTEGE